MKKNIAALIIAAAMISTPGILNATSVANPTHYFGVSAQDVNPQTTTWSVIGYKFNSEGSSPFRWTAWRQGSYWFPYTLVNDGIVLRLYDWEEKRYTGIDTATSNP